MSRVAKSAKTAVIPSVSESKNKFEITVNDYFVLRWGLYEKGIKPHSDNDLKKFLFFTKSGLMEKHEDGSFHTKPSLIDELNKIAAFLARPKEFKDDQL
jgi:hypothetical protein